MGVCADRHTQRESVQGGGKAEKSEEGEERGGEKKAQRRPVCGLLCDTGGTS